MNMRGGYLIRKQKMKKMKVLFIFSIIIVLAVSVFAIKSLGSSSQGTIIKSSSDFFSTNKAEALTVIEVEGEYIKFEYIDSFRPTPARKLIPPQLETFNFVTKKVPFWELSIGVRDLPSGKINDDGSYNLRATDTVNYKKEQLEINGALIAVFSDIRQDFSKVAFLLSDNKLLSVAITGSGDNDKMQKHLEDIVSSIKWK
jgi:hypothetical protein